MKNKIELLAIIAILFFMIMNFGTANAEEVHVNRDSVSTNGAVNQVVVVNSVPAPVFKSRTRSVPSSVVNNYYDRHCDASCDLHGPVDPPNRFMIAPVTNDKFDYQDIWLIVLSILFALGLGIFIGYLIWNRRGEPTGVIVHSYGGSSTSTSHSRSGAVSRTGRSDSPTPVAPAPSAPASPASVQEDKK